MRQAQAPRRAFLSEAVLAEVAHVACAKCVRARTHPARVRRDRRRAPHCAWLQRSPELWTYGGPHGIVRATRGPTAVATRSGSLFHAAIAKLNFGFVGLAFGSVDPFSRPYSQHSGT